MKPLDCLVDPNPVAPKPTAPLPMFAEMASDEPREAKPLPMFTDPRAVVAENAALRAGRVVIRERVEMPVVRVVAEGKGNPKFRTAKVGHADKVNANNRVYPRSEWDAQVSRVNAGPRGHSWGPSTTRAVPKGETSAPPPSSGIAST